MTRRHDCFFLFYYCLMALALITTTPFTEAFAPPATTNRIAPGSLFHKSVQHSLRSPQQQAQARVVATTTKTLSTTTTTQLQMAPQVGLSAIAGAISGGLFAGGLHAIAGPDHLAALLPRCCGQRWYRAGPVGALWGMGHGLSATLLGVLAFALKNTLRVSSSAATSGVVSRVLSGASHLTELAVGLSLLVIGVLGLKEAREFPVEETTTMQSLSAAAAAPASNSSGGRGTAVVLNGLLHGFSWDGAPSLAPALAVATWGGNLAFLSAYAAGTVATMALATSLIGEGTRQAGQFFQRPDIPQKLSVASSILAMAIGVVWCGLAVVK